jgi:hypothetical protein
MDRWGEGSYVNTGFIVEKWSCRGDPQQESCFTQLLTDWGWIKKGGLGSTRKVTGWINLQCPPDPSKIMA